MATLNARLREGTGKGVTRKMRAAGEVPAVAYGHGVENRKLAVNAHELNLLLASINAENTIIDLHVDGARSAQVLIREVQRHPSRPIIYHLDLFQVRAGEKLHVEVPVLLQGNPVGVRESGGVLQEILRELTVECLPADIPQAIEVDVAHLQLGESIHVSDVQVEKATILNDPELVICTVSVPSVAALPEDTEAEEDVDGEPEMVRRTDEDEGTEEE